MTQPWRQAISYPEKLPVSRAKDTIMNALAEHQVLILQSETGSGKSTQIPKMLLEFLGKEKPRVALTQPRRLPTKLLAQRLNHELSGGAARWVGWQVRFEKQLHPGQLIKVMTEGILWQELVHHHLLTSYDALILDEVHERSITMDLLLGAMPALLKKRPDFRLVLLSATLDQKLFQDFFPQAQALELEGRSYPIEDFYCPETLEEPTQKLLWALDHAERLTGDVLVFCATESEILFYEKKLCALRPAWEYCCLYARMIHRQQKNLFHRSTRRRVILSTNVAETSITLPSVRIVIDLGRQKILQFHPQYRVNSYPIVATSRQSITQRRGRAGRTESGWCFHLYSEQDELERPAALLPEIQRSALSQVVLQVLCLRAQPVEKFPFISPPSVPQLKEALKLLRLLGLVDKRDRLQPQGRQVARYPLDPRFCMVLLEAQQCHCGYSVAVIVGFLSGDDPRLRPSDALEKADKAHLRYHDLRSDFMSILSLWVAIQSQRRESSHKSFQKYCHDHFLNPVSIRQWELQVKQLCDLVGIKPRDLDVRALEEDFFLIHRALLAGFFDRLYQRLPKKPGRMKHYQGAHGVQAYIHPGSVLKSAKSEWVFAIDQHHDPQGQTRLRWVGPVELPVAQKYLQQQIRYQYSSPFYAPETGEVMVYKTGYAWGIPVLPAVAELYRLLKLEETRRFICTYFVTTWSEEDFVTVPLWQKSWERAQELAHRSRHLSALLSGSALAEKIWDQGYWPEMMISRETVERYLNTLPSMGDTFFLREDLKLSLSDFPSTLTIDGHKISVEYDPHTQDFLHYTIPGACWRSQQPSSWLVAHPYFGVLLLESLLNQLPKKSRQKIGDLHECAQFFQQDYGRNQSLWQALSNFLWGYYDVACAEKDFKVYQIPQYLLPHFWIGSGDQLDYLGAYQFDDDRFTHSPVAIQRAAATDPWAEIAQSAQRGIYRLYEAQNNQWHLFPAEQYWHWRALLSQHYGQELWKRAPARLHSVMFPPGLMLTSEKLVVWRGVYLGQQCPQLLITDSDGFEAVVQDKALFKQYSSLLHRFALEFEPSWRQLARQRWPDAWLPLKDVLQEKLFLSHLNPEMCQRLPQWLAALTVALEKAPRKLKLVAQWAEQWQQIVDQLAPARLDVAHPLWSVALEGIVAVFDPAQSPVIPWSEKKIVKLAEQQQLWAAQRL